MRLIALCLLLVVAFVGCSDSKDKKTALKVFKYNQPNAVTSLDPAFARSQTNIWAVDHLYNGLVQLNDSLKVVPAIAKNWKISGDGLTYTFTLRSDVYFHANPCFGSAKHRIVSAFDFEYSFKRLLDEKVQSPGSWVFIGKVDSSEAFKAINDTVFQLKLAKPFKPMISMLTMQYCCVVPKEAVEYYGKDFRRNPVGTGPFQFKRWIENQTLFLNKNPDYFEVINGKRLPYLEGIRVDFISDRKSAFLKFMKGDIDFFSGLESSFINALLTSEGELQEDLKAKINFNKKPYLNTEFIGINYTILPDNHPLRNKYFRQALNYSINRSQMLKLLRNNVGKPAESGIVPPGLQSYQSEIENKYAYDLSKVRALLNKAGYPNGEGLPNITLHCNKDYLDICTFLSRQWQQAGIPITIETVESATLREMMRNGKTSFFRASWIGDYPDEENYFSLFFSGNGAPPNYTRFKNADYDLLYDKLLRSTNPIESKEICKKMNEIILEESPVVLLFYDETAQFVQKNISGLNSDVMNILSVKRILKSKPITAK